MTGSREEPSRGKQMEFSIKTGSPEKQRTGCVVVGVYEGRRLTSSAQDIDDASGHFIAEVLRRGDHEGKAGTTLLLHNVPKVPADRVLLVGLGREREFGENTYRGALAATAKALKATGTTEAMVCLTDLPLKKRDTGWKVEQAVLCIMDGVYRFDRMKSKASETKRALRRVVLHVARRNEIAEGETAVIRGQAIAEGIALTKDLGNLPANICTPTYLAEQAQELAKRHGMKADILEQKDLEKLGMGSFLAVARGSRQPPKLIVLEYHGGARDAQPVAIVGKGVTFDTGGISIKPAPEMDEMKFDMCGAASVLGTMKAIALMKLPLNVIGVVPATENMPDGNAVKPGDIVTTMSGQTVEILNTDAEGRLILCDALTYVEKFKPAAVIDIATLTGAMVIALGHVATGMFSNSDTLAREVLAAGDSSWDRAWHMPMWDDYQEGLKSNFADIPNIAGRAGGSITAACFLSRFTKAYPWAHLDIAGTAWKSGAEKSATGRPVALLTHWLLRRAS
ncbi:leucyl aminopeptidase [Betaproteobacteria bacterium GR16-43]|nr:leucyl aminopeptidase [Betaproteobacteria bacterium GR16-43]